jgi:ketosteroid isomerase-like protein
VYSAREADLTRKKARAMGEAETIRRAAADLVSAFGEHRSEDYFACFAEGATFVFHNVAQVLHSREEHWTLWRRWERDDDFRVLGCESTNANLSLIGDFGIFTHDVRTTVATSAGESRLQERETIVFAKQADGAWLAVHEHLSPQSR